MLFNLFKKKPEVPPKKKVKIYPIGRVTHYFSKLKVAIVEIEQGDVTLDDILFIKGNLTRFRQRVRSIEYNHQKISKAPAGYEIGLQVGAKARVGDVVYKEVTSA